MEAGREDGCQLKAKRWEWMQELRRCAEGTSLAATQMATLRKRLLELAAWFGVSTRRIVVHLPRSFGWKPNGLRIAARLHATFG